MKHILSLGELLIDLIPIKQVRLGEACYAPHAGGATANVAVAIARLGGSVRFIGAFSEDQFGQLLMQALIDNNVDVRYTHLARTTLTTVALVTLHPDGQRHFTFFREQTADSQLRVEDLNWDAWNDVAVCHVGGVLLSTEPGRSATLAAIEHTHQAGSIVSFDANIRPALWDSPSTIHNIMTKVVEQVDILKLSIEEAEFLIEEKEHFATDTLEPSELKRLGDALLEKGPRFVIITRGPRGALLLTHKHQIEVPAMLVRPVDTTGAGDAFMGTILYQLVQQGMSTPAELLTLSERDIRNLGTLANHVAGLSCTRYGGISSFPYMHEVRSVMASIQLGDQG
ncbi:carbohydrate kinase family protein [Dictyobacter formicarum]|uniref:Aminoimidazole riboside kinase n=1 Tax=Dictyobacter formicarum TaxID=2778368 RepID=A0ABQ3VBG9_9CHLR|nr:carbohydrate kinase [Dictyobacter formicarum]GHO82811.1 aminoimidazole riboside kinase [Dictyobacter formicarum]